MIEPFGAVRKARYQLFAQMGFQIVVEGDYSMILQSEDKTIALTIERYTPCDIQLSFIGKRGEIYPLWMIRIMIDIDGYNRDKAQLRAIQDEYGLRDGNRGMALFRKGVKLHTALYVELATQFLRRNLYLVNLNKEEFKKELVNFSPMECYLQS